ncbi:MAG: transcriptional regulator, TraR/DksA family [Frankiales bacterium]|nr:transcriptional regulator, TraR/DksA family [Frankiales bacterium]
MDLQDAREQLEQMLTELDAATTTLENEGAGESSELSTHDQHPADTASEIADADRENAIIEAAEEQRVQVRAALARIEDGSYGTCTDCGTQISEARLQVRPEAARCIECQSKAEAAA